MRWRFTPTCAQRRWRGADYPAALATVKRRQAIREAIEILQEGFQPSLFK